MDRRTPGYLLPSSRRVDHVYSIAVRNLHLPPEVGVGRGWHLFYVLFGEGEGCGSTAATAPVLYVSEWIPATPNPTWAPMEWEPCTPPPTAPGYLHSTGTTAAVAALKRPSCVLQICAACLPAATSSRGRSTWGMGGGMSLGGPTMPTRHGACATSMPVYFPSNTAPVTQWLRDTVDAPRVLWCVRVHAPTLHALGFDMLEALSLGASIATAGGGGGGGGRDGAVIVDWTPPSSGGGGGALPYASGGYGSGSGGGGGGEGSSSSLATFTLDALPLNTCILACDDGAYLHPDVMRRLKGEVVPIVTTWPAPLTTPPSPAVSTMSPPPLMVGSTATARLDVRKAFDSLHRLMQLRRETAELQRAEVGTLHSVQQVLATASQVYPPCPAGVVARVERLRHCRDALLQEVTSKGIQYAAAVGSVTARARGVQRQAQRIGDVAATTLPLAEEEVDNVRGEVALLRTMISAKQLSLIAELRSIYPIVEVTPGSVYAIRGAKLPDRDLTSLPEEQVSTALGYTCHCVQLLSKYLNTPLRYSIVHLASRSVMRDEVLPGPAAAAWGQPLYWKGMDTHAFTAAVRMLQRDVEQLCFSQGLSVMIESHLLANLTRLYQVLLDAPLPPAEASAPTIVAPPATAACLATDAAAGTSGPPALLVDHESTAQGATAP